MTIFCLSHYGDEYIDEIVGEKNILAVVGFPKATCVDICIANVPRERYNVMRRYFAHG